MEQMRSRFITEQTKPTRWRSLLACGLLLSILACSRPIAGPAHIDAMPHLTQSEQTTLPDGRNALIKEEYFVINNPPTDKAAFLKLVKEFNRTTIPAEKPPQQFALIRMFYRANEKLTANYQEDRRGYFDKEQIGNHADDLVLTVKYRQDMPDVTYEFETQRRAYQELFGAQPH